MGSAKQAFTSSAGGVGICTDKKFLILKHASEVGVPISILFVT